MITLVVVAFNFVGDGLRDALDPRLKGLGLARK
jgi:ABC-type dipeptide/oligopeptide/nickel transport system permease subunit